MAIKFLNSQETQNEINTSEILIVNFYADWCGPCKMMTPIFDDLSNSQNVVKVNVDEPANKAYAKSFGVASLPTSLLFRAGKLFKKIEGYAPKEVYDAQLKAI